MSKRSRFHLLSTREGERGTMCLCADEYELEQPYMRVHDTVTVELLSRFIQDRILSLGSDPLRVRLHCRGQLLAGHMSVARVVASLWRLHAVPGQLLKLRLEWFDSGRQPSPSLQKQPSVSMTAV